ncbi:MAG: sigma-70 family RNA polymerase sigma factor [Pyrinomonadaceae bacterium]|nr:sigma-70 family RNA polymerase sigma factor [Pyrinomonadaceae bacterium]
MEVRPLTHHTADTGAVYERSAEVEAQVVRSLALEETRLMEELQHDYKSDAHIKDEALCYLIRERLREGVHESANAFAEILLRRCAKTISRRIERRGIEERHREDCAGEIATDLLTDLFDIDSDRSDFAQVRFGLYLKMLSNGAINRFLELQRREQQALSVAYTQDDKAEEIDLLDTLADENALSNEDRVLMEDALAQLPKDLREIYRLRYFDGWQIESASTSEPSISRHLNVTSRTVRNRLREAEAILKRWREGK